MFSRPPICKQNTRLTASLIAWVAPLLEAGKKEYTASPMLTTQAPGAAHFGYGLHQKSSKLTMVSGGVSLMSSLNISAQGCGPTPLSMLARTSKAGMVLDHDSF